MILLAYAQRDGSQRPARLWLVAGTCGLLLFVGCQGIIAFAQQRFPFGVAAIILATIPFWIAIIGFVAPSKKSGRLWTLALLAPGLAGVVLIAWSQVAVGQASLPLFDILLMLIASFAWACGSVLMERNASPEISAFAISGTALIVGGLALLGVSILAGEFQRFTFAELSVNSTLDWAYLVLGGDCRCIRLVCLAA